MDVFIFVQIQLRHNAAETTKSIKWAFGHYFWKVYLLLSNIKIVFLYVHWNNESAGRPEDAVSEERLRALAEANGNN